MIRNLDSVANLSAVRILVLLTCGMTFGKFLCFSRFWFFLSKNDSLICIYTNTIMEEKQSLKEIHVMSRLRIMREDSSIEQRVRDSA